MPTGVALRDARQQLFAAAERVLLRDGAGGLTSRAVTEEAGVAKGVLHRHFADFDDFLAGLVRDRIARLEREARELEEAAGASSVVAAVSAALSRVFTPVVLQLVALLTSRDGLRARLRETTPRGVPLLTEASAGLASYLAAERDLGRLLPQADPEALAFALVGTGHMLFAGELGGLPDESAVAEVVAAILVGAEPGAPAGV